MSTTYCTLSVMDRANLGVDWEVACDAKKIHSIRTLIAERINQAEINFKDDRLATQLREIRDAAGL